MLTSCGCFLQENTCVGMESLFNSEYCKIFISTYFQEHFQMAALENVFIKIIYKKIYFHVKKMVFQHQYQKHVKMFAFIS